MQCAQLPGTPYHSGLCLQTERQKTKKQTNILLWEVTGGRFLFLCFFITATGNVTETLGNVTETLGKVCVLYNPWIYPQLRIRFTIGVVKFVYCISSHSPSVTAASPKARSLPPPMGYLTTAHISNSDTNISEDQGKASKKGGVGFVLLCFFLWFRLKQCVSSREALVVPSMSWAQKSIRVSVAASL